MHLEGLNGQLRITDTHVTITRDGAVAARAFGPGPHAISYAHADVVGARFCPAESAATGWLQLLTTSASGLAPTTTSALTAPDTIVFTQRDTSAFAKAKLWLDQLAAANLGAAPAPSLPAARPFEPPRQRDEGPTSDVTLAGMHMMIEALRGRGTRT